MNYILIASVENGGVLVALGVILGLNIASSINPLKLKNPGVSEVYYAIAKNYMMFVDYGKAVEYFKATLALNPKSISALNDLGMVYLNVGQYQEALFWFEKAISIDPQSLNPQFNRTLCLEKISNSMLILSKNRQSYPFLKILIDILNFIAHNIALFVPGIFVPGEKNSIEKEDYK